MVCIALSTFQLCTYNSFRDEEIRFNVHESPDYYKLKCSVFNEDKRNDLIGEVWIDLREVIIAGGGKSDIWHQLHFKGKYAGEVRVELTYYDTRPKDESALAQQRQRAKNRTNSGNSFAATVPGGPRQLGPREVKRRPLPQGPPGSSPAVRPQLPDHVHSAPITAPAWNQSSEPSPDHRDLWAPDMHYHDGIDRPASHYSSTYESNHLDQRQPREDPTDFPQRESSVSQEFYQPEDQQQDYHERDLSAEPGELNYHSANDPQRSSPTIQSPYYSPNREDRRLSIQPAFSPYDNLQQPTPLAYTSSPPSNYSPNMIRSAPGSGDHRQRAQVNCYNTTPVKNDSYRDSPLRQSISHHEATRDLDMVPGYSEDQPPPPPPAHGERFPHSAAPSHIYHDTNTFQIPRKLPASSPTAISADTRSPLQAIERNFDQYYSPVTSSLPPARRQDSYDSYAKPAYNQYEPQSGNTTFPRPSSSRENEPPPSFNGGYDTLPMMTDEPSTFVDDGMRRRSNGSFIPEQTRVSFRSSRPDQAFQFPDITDHPRPFQSQPPIVKPRDVSPDMRHTLQRKSVSPHPASPQSEGGLAGVPFGPDSYDVLNPPSTSTGSVKGHVPTPEQIKEAARLVEVERLREQGPIIGNDGREIDPSDHLPSDTWAPEPERKTRKPEVVIRFRTKDEATRTPNSYRSSPDAIRPVSMPVPTYNNSPLLGDSPSTATATFKTGRNRLQKQMPVRPLPVQPYQHAQSSPAVPLAPPVSTFATPSPGSRLPLVSTPPSGSRLPQRPALSEYSVMQNRGYGSSPQIHGYEPSPPRIPAKVPFYGAESSNRESYGGGMDALSAEMQNIDIGVGSGVRSGGRSRRVFET